MLSNQGPGGSQDYQALRSVDQVWRPIVKILLFVLVISLVLFITTTNIGTDKQYVSVVCFNAARREYSLSKDLAKAKKIEAECIAAKF